MAEVEGTVTPPLSTLSSLSPVQGKVSAIHMSAFFHLFLEDRQLQLAKIVSSLLSPEKGSVIFGQHSGLPVKGLKGKKINGVDLKMFFHSPESWTQMWTEDVFNGNNRVKVDTELVSVVRKGLPDPDDDIWLKWSVTRL